MTEDEQSGPLGFGDSDEPSEPATPDAGEGQAGPADRPPPPPRPTVNTQKYTWFVGVVAIIILIYIGINTLENGPGAEGVGAGKIVPPFAAPIAPGGPNGDVNVATEEHRGQAGKVPACSIHQPGVLTICDAYARRPLMLVFFATRGDCTNELDAIARVAPRFPGVGVAAVAIRGSRDALDKLVVNHGWKFPVAYDRDGILANLYSVVVCPQITYVRRGGRAAGTTFRRLSQAEIVQRFEALRDDRIIRK